ncbi:MAG TPA: hypothetical protein VNT26_07155 [Candidatus Sulfotelmatobacter sp.]|nr:hypothetical protein [Candidatus Sulfotelmatobacter sp.]
MTQCFSAHHMKVKVRHNLAGILTGVCHRSVAGFSYAHGFGYVLHGSKYAAQHGGIVSMQIIHRSEVFFGNYQYMNRGLRLNVVESQHLIIFVNLVGRYLAGDNLTENAVS